MTLHFAYGLNMSRKLMRRRCPQARPLGPARLIGFRFVISRDGFASVVPAAGAVVHGVLWRLSPRDRMALDVFENVAGGLYRRRFLPVRQDGRCRTALVYVARGRGGGRPRPGYQARVVEAAGDWRLPCRYVASLARTAGTRFHGAVPAETGEAGQ